MVAGVGGSRLIDGFGESGPCAWLVLVNGVRASRCETCWCRFDSGGGGARWVRRPMTGDFDLVCRPERGAVAVIAFALGLGDCFLCLRDVGVCCGVSCEFK